MKSFKKLKLIKLILLLMLFSVNYAKTSPYQNAHEIYRQGNEALIDGKYEQAKKHYEELIELLKTYPQYKTAFAYNYYQIPILEVIRKREALGTINPVATHKIKVVYLMHTQVEVPDKKGKQVKVDISLSPDDIKASKTWLGMFKVYLEVLSAGKLSVEFDFASYTEPLTKMNEFSSQDYEGRNYSSRYPEINSVAGLDQLIYSALDKTDTFLFYYKSKGADPRPVGGAAFLPVVSYFKDSPLRGRLLIPVEYKNGGVLLHEFFHSLEYLAKIRPGHGFTKSIRKNFPDWKGEGQYDYFSWHFENTLEKFGYEKLNFIQRYPVKEDKSTYDFARKKASEIPLDMRLKALEYYREGEALEKKGMKAAALSKYRESLRQNPYQLGSLKKIGQERLNQKKYTDAQGYISRALKLESTDPALLYNQGIVYYHTKKRDLALKSMSEAIKADPEMEKAYYYRGFLYLASQKFEQAEADFIQAVSVNPAYQKTVLDFLSKYLNSPKYQQAVKGMIGKIQELGK